MDFSTNKKKVDLQKLRGGYYTPLKLADYLCKWALKGDVHNILEPSAGDGNFLIAALQNLELSKLQKLEIVAVEIEEAELNKAKQRVSKLNTKENIAWVNSDFFVANKSLKSTSKFDVVLGNPPFIRFQYFDDTSRKVAFEQLRNAGYKPTKLANAWVAFVELSIELLKDGGKLAMVLPAELLQVKYAAELRKSLAKHFQHIIIIGFRKLVFPEIQQEVVLLLAEGKRVNNEFLSDIQTIEFEDGDDLLQRGKDLKDTVAHVPAKHTRNGMKWTSLFLSDLAFKVLDEAEKHPKLEQLKFFADVNVGIVTGFNSFFVLTETLRNELEASNVTVPIIGRTAALRSIIFDNSDYATYKQLYPSALLDLNGIPFDEIPDKLKNYLALGEEKRVHLGYKCSLRPRWYDVPSIYIPDAFLFRQIHKYPLLVINQANVTSTDTIHRVRFKVHVKRELFATSFYNSLTLAWAEVSGRSYGGGVLELEPKEAIELPIPYFENSPLNSVRVNNLLRQGKEEDALDYVDSIVLKDWLGFSKSMIKGIRQAWHELRERRTNRR